MNFKFNVPGKKRKDLVGCIAEWLDETATYAGAPTFAYKVGEITVDKDGGVTFPEGMDEDATERLLEHLYDEGYECEGSEGNDAEIPAGLMVSVPLNKVKVGNLTNLIEAKGQLIKKALGIEETPVAVTPDAVCFPWFKRELTPEEVKAYSHFIAALCEMSRNQNRITAKEKDVENEKYAFRCFLLRLGFIGEEYKAERKILLRNLEGSSAFRSPKAKEAEA